MPYRIEWRQRGGQGTSTTATLVSRIVAWLNAGKPACAFDVYALIILNLIEKARSGGSEYAALSDEIKNLTLPDNVTGFSPITVNGLLTSGLACPMQFRQGGDAPNFARSLAWIQLTAFNRFLESQATLKEGLVADLAIDQTVLANVSQTVSKALNDFKDVTDFRALLATLNGYKTEALGQQRPVLTALEAPTQQTERSLALAFLNNKAFSVETRTMFVTVLLAATAKACSANALARSSGSNKSRLFNFMTALKDRVNSLEVTVSDNVDWSRKSAYKDDLAKVATAISQNLPTDKNAVPDFTEDEIAWLTYKDGIVAEARKRLSARLRTTSGVANMESAFATDLAGFERAKLVKAMNDLIDVINLSLREVEAAATFQDDPPMDGSAAATRAVGVFDPYVLFRFEDYHSRWGGRISQPDPYNLTTFQNTLRIPLISLNNNPTDPHPSLTLCNYAGQDVKQHLCLTNFRPPDSDVALADVLIFFRNGELVRDSNQVVQLLLKRQPGDKRRATSLQTSYQSQAKGYYPIWRWDFAFRRPYVPFYLVGVDGVQSHLVCHLSSGFSAGIGRADEISGADYRWAFRSDPKALAAELQRFAPSPDGFGNLDATMIGRFLELDPACKVGAANDLQSLIDVETPADPNPFKYGFLARAKKQDDARNEAMDESTGEGADGSEEPEFVLCHTPYLPPTLKTPLSSDRLQNFLFYYFRRVGFGDDSRVSRKVLKNRAVQETFKNRPRAADVGPANRDEKEEKATTIGVGLPISLHVDDNYAKLRALLANVGPIKNKGATLGSPGAARLAGGAVMRPIADFQAPGGLNLYPGASLPANDVATAFANRSAQLSTDLPIGLPFWQALKSTDLAEFPTDQEWCHLMGHGDGGGESVSNFVAGSEHCNTEQLAIESAQRRTTQSSGDYKLNCTAYLINDRSMENHGDTYYFGLRNDYLRQAYLNKMAKPLQTTNEPAGEDKYPDAVFDEADRAGHNVPIAAFVRYKVSKAAGNASAEKIFDYIFESQSEFFDRNQFNILTRTIQYLIDSDGFYNDLTEFYYELEAERVGKRKDPPPRDENDNNNAIEDDDGDHGMGDEKEQDDDDNGAEPPPKKDKLGSS